MTDSWNLSTPVKGGNAPNSMFLRTPPSGTPPVRPSSSAAFPTSPQVVQQSSYYGGSGGSPLFSSPHKATPERQTPDRFIPDRGSHDRSLSYFYLTSKENAAAPASVLQSSDVKSPHKLLSTSAPSPAIASSEPYTQMLARTLFPAPQTSVLGLHEPNIPLPSEEDRYAKSLGVVYEENRHQNFISKHFRVIAQTPERILDAPELLDDFYLNLVDWSSTNQLTVALRHTVYLWNAETGGITQLMSSSDQDNYITSVSWHQDGDLLAVALDDSEVQIWSATSKSLVQTVKSHSKRVGSLSWNGSVLAAGSRDKTISLTDTRERRSLTTLNGHSQEVCGLRWSPNGQQLASGGNDNLLNIWDFRRYSMECMPLFSLKQHTAAVKALAWNPVQSNLLASGGGTTDRTIRFWDTTTGECLHRIDAKSQVCGVLWSRSGTELVSSHGLSDNQLSLWKYPTLRKVCDLTGHTSRVLHLAMSPDGEMVVSASGDETIRFWRCFPPSPHLSGRSHNHVGDEMSTLSSVLGGQKPPIGSPSSGRRSTGGSRWDSGMVQSPGSARYSVSNTLDEEALR